MKKRILFILILLILGTATVPANELDEKLYPGNLLHISLFDNASVTKNYRIDPQGFIYLPEVGKINCNDQTLSSLRRIVVKALSSIYKNASGLTLIKKSNDIYINVLGLVEKPGPYLIPLDGTIQLAFQEAGGLSEGAQMNKIQLRHAGKTTIIDYKKYLDSGDEKLLPKFSARDEIFVPSSNLITNIRMTHPSTSKTGEPTSWLDTPSNQAVKIIGGIARPGRYKWSDEMNLLDLIAEAGGPTAIADTTNIQIIPKKTNKGNVHTIKFNLKRFMADGGNLSVVPTIKAGYTINIPEVDRKESNEKMNWTQQDAKTVVYVFGEVKSPGRYNFDNKLNFLDILSAASGPTDKADLHDVHLIDRQGIYPQVVHVNLSLYFETGDAELIPPVLSGDAVFVPEKDKEYTEINSKHVVKVLGEVAKPGRYRYTSNMTLLDLLSAAGGPTSAAMVTKILIVNIGPKLEARSSTFDMMKFSRTGDMRMLPTIREGDVIYVPNNNEDNKKRFAELLTNLANIALIISYGRTLA